MQESILLGCFSSSQSDWLFQDVAQSGQVDIFISACKRFLNIDGIGLLSLKAASERWTGEDEQHLFKSVEEKLFENGFETRKASN